MKKMTYKEFKEFIKTPKGKALAFFGVYLIFFIFIGLFARLGGSTLDRNYETGSSLEFSVASIINKNFKFNYKVVVDGVGNTYDGSSTQSASMFTVNNLDNYYYNGSGYFSNVGGIWINVNNPIVAGGLIESANIKTILENATYISKTEYDSGKKVYNYNISSASINKILENVDVDIEEIPNEIHVSVDSDKVVNEIKYNLDSYCKVKGLCVNTMEITLKYEGFGTVKEITSPLE